MQMPEQLEMQTLTVPDSLAKMLPVRDDKGNAVLKVGLFLTLYFRNAHEASKRDAVLSCVEDFLGFFSSRIDWGILGVGKPQSVDTFPPNATADYLKSVDVEDDDGWQVYWHSGVPSDASDFGIQIFGKARAFSEEMGHLSYLTMHAPINNDQLAPDKLTALALQWCERLQPVHGYGGVGIIRSADKFVASHCEPEEFALAQRFPTLDVDYPLDHALWTREGIKGGNWLTVLSEPLVQRLTVDHPMELPDSFSLHRYSGGLIIQAGKLPTIVDRNLGEESTSFRALARILQPLRIKIHPAVHTSHGKFTRQAFEEWLMRFESAS